MSAAEMREALKPCPFCGGEAAIEKSGHARQSMIIACQQCGARVESGDVSGLTAVKDYRWNRRAPLLDEEGMVERVSDAICRAAGGDPDGCEAHFHRKCEDCRMRARAALRAINGGKP